MTIFWFSLGILLIVVEISTVNLVSIWFSIGSFVTMIVSMFTDSILIQLITFIITSIIALLITKPLANKFKKKKILPTNYDRVIGQVAEVTKDILPDNYGEVKVLGSYWTAISSKKIVVGEKVIVKKVEGVKLIVEKEEK